MVIIIPWLAAIKGRERFRSLALTPTLSHFVGEGERQEANADTSSYTPLWKEVKGRF
jgi:hypothetical protein